MANQSSQSTGPGSVPLTRAQRAIVVTRHKVQLERERAKLETAKFKHAQAAAGLDALKAAVPYQAAYTSRVDSYWSMSLSMTGIREINRFNLRRMRDRARQLERENVLACAILDRCCDYVIGTGLRLQPSTSDEAWNNEVVARWDAAKDSLDITGRFAFGRWQWMFYRSHLRDGDVGTVLVARGPDSFLQTISGDYIDSINSASLDNVGHVHGMELGPDGQVLKYTVKSADENGTWKETAVPARNMVFFPRAKQLTDYRGEPLFAPIFGLLEQMDKYREAEIIKKRLEACQGIIVRKPTALQSYGALGSTTGAAGDLRQTLNVEPAMIHYLNVGEDVTAFTPSAGTQDFNALMKFLCSFLGLNCGLTINMLLLDYTGMSFTAGKAGALQSEQHARVEHEHIIRGALRPVYYWWLAREIKHKGLRVPSALVNNYWENEWVPNRFPLLDPPRELAGQLAEIDAGLNSYTGVARSRGDIHRKTIEQLSNDLAFMASKGIVPSKSTLTRDLAATAPPGASPAPTTAQDKATEEAMSSDKAEE